jgi:predicted DNA-binding WGR domain protein
MVQRLMAFLTRIDPARNINRFYVVQVMPSLFGHSRHPESKEAN